MSAPCIRYVGNKVEVLCIGPTGEEWRPLKMMEIYRPHWFPRNALVQRAVRYVPVIGENETLVWRDNGMPHIVKA